MNAASIKSLRKSLGMTQTQFYDKLGLKTSSPDAKRQTITRWENGTRNPSNAALALLNGLANNTAKKIGLKS